VREGYRLEQRGGLSLDHLIAPKGELVALADTTTGSYATVRSKVEGIETRNVNNGTELRKVLGDMAEEHYQLTTTPHQRFRDRLNKCVDYPLVKLLGILAAMVAAVASVLALVR